MHHNIKETVRLLRKNQTETEKILWEKLRNRNLGGKKFVRQYPFQYAYFEKSSFFVVDFYCAELKLAIEIDGSSHRGKEFYDEIREEILEFQGVRILRFTTSQIYNHLEAVLSEIVRAIAG